MKMSFMNVFYLGFWCIVDAVSEELSKQNDTYQNMWIR